MNLSIDKFNVKHLTYEETSVLAAFTGMNGFYGVPSDWMDSGYGDLRNKIRRVVRDMELKNTIFLEPGGNVCINADVYYLLSEMKNATKVARVAYGTQYIKEVIYFYRSDNMLAYIKGDNRGGCHLGAIPDKESLLKLITGPSDHDGKDDWSGMLVMAKTGEIFKTVYDMAWRENSGVEITGAWNEFVNSIWD